MNPKVKSIAKNLNSVDGQTFESCNSRAGFEPLTFGYEAQEDNALNLYVCCFIEILGGGTPYLGRLRDG
jgi:hypothetical protein